MMDAILHYGVAIAVVLAFTGVNHGVSLRAFHCAIILALVWVVTVTLTSLLPYPEALYPFPVVDAVAGGVVSVFFWRHPRLWNAALASTFLIMAAIHVQFWIGQAGGEGYDKVSPYMDKLSLLVIIQLAVVCIPGGLSVARKLCSLSSWVVGRLFRGALPYRGFSNAERNR